MFDRRLKFNYNKNMDKRFKRIYVEITNACNLNCTFCPKTKREKKFLSIEEFDLITDKLFGYTDYLFFHVMGEPLLHSNLIDFLQIAKNKGYNVNITTNGTLLNNCVEKLLNFTNLKKVFISLHSFEGNNGKDLTTYLNNVWNFCTKRKFIVSLRLWNIGGKETKNNEIIKYLSEKTGKDLFKLFEEKNSITIGENLFLEKANKFIWPSENEKNEKVNFCYGLIDQLGILSNGNVVPCCLDNEGEITLGNIFTQNLNEILNGNRAIKFLEGYKNRTMSENLCNHCEYASKFYK